MFWEAQFGFGVQPQESPSDSLRPKPQEQPNAPKTGPQQPKIIMSLTSPSKLDKGSEMSPVFVSIMTIRSLRVHGSTHVFLRATIPFDVPVT